MILDGRKLSQKIINDLGAQPAPWGRLAVIQVGDDPVSTLYVAKKKEAAQALGIDFELNKFDEVISQSELINEIKRLNSDSSIRAILVQIPLPSQINRLEVAKEISPEKDIDGFHCILHSGNFKCVPPTVLAIVELLEFYKINLAEKKILIVGGGFLVGQPLFDYFKARGLNVEILGKKDQGYEEKLKEADIAIISTGGGRSFSFVDFKSGATVIDASTVAEEGKIRGDVENDILWPEDINLAPVPGGVGPVTVAMLFKNFFYNL
jgi:methylenetetrahydrofolate dehydrogenase (NADP+)/methenyltetrahydrofolate cyclohydrolase